jgi:DNA invertase Pin-like site-specific DNA recombinase
VPDLQLPRVERLHRQRSAILETQQRERAAAALNAAKVVRATLDEGVPPAEVAAAFGVSVRQMYRRLAEHGLTKGSRVDES